MSKYILHFKNGWFLLQFIVYRELLVKSSQNLHGGSVSEAKVISESIIIGPGGGGGGGR